MIKIIQTTVFALSAVFSIGHCYAKTSLELNEKEYFSMPGLDVTFFADIYPDGHQTGVTVIQHGTRVAANGDLRLEISPGQWSPVPRSVTRTVDQKTQTISQTLAYPDPDKNRKGFNPIEYPDLDLTYTVNISPLEGSAFEVTVDLDTPIPDAWLGKVGFNFELFPGEYFGNAYLMKSEKGDTTGIFPRQPNGPINNFEDSELAEPLATGNQLVVAPDAMRKKMTITGVSGPVSLWDGRTNHNNGWFIVRTAIKKGVTKKAVHWIIEPAVDSQWRYSPVIQVSQVGYAADQKKTLVIEQDIRQKKASKVTLYRLTEKGREKILQERPANWGQFLRYNYFVLDFSNVTTNGLYVAEYEGQTSHTFQINNAVFERHVWQPTLEYYLPVQMCHMRVNEKYRVWHDLCHEDDALMSPINHNHFDGYIAGSSTLTSFKPQERVPHLNKGGWHDAGDYDLRVESQAGTVWLLAAMIEEFGLNLDTTTIDQEKQHVEIHQADGINDAVQQVEHGLLTILGGYKALGRLYRGIIVPTIPQYVLLGDAGAQTDGLPYNAALKPGEIKNDSSGNFDDRWVFTEDNPDRALETVGAIAAGARVIKNSNPRLHSYAKEAAIALFKQNFTAAKIPSAKAYALSELYLLTLDKQFLDLIESLREDMLSDIAHTGWRLARVRSALGSSEFSRALDAAIAKHQQTVNAQAAETPYGVPYKPNIWGAGWGIQEFGVRQYFFNKAWPNVANENIYLNALNFVLGVHPGSNTMSFASGVGAQSALVAYGVNRADWSFIPGGVISGTALIRPDLPELKIWPFFWQQTEYVMGGGATNFMFLALAANQRFNQGK